MKIEPIEVPFGSPKSNDATARREERIKRAAKRRNERIQRGVNILNRPIGSRTDLSPEEQKQDWLMVVNDPNEAFNRLSQRAQVVGPTLAAWEQVTWDAEMQNKYGRTS